MAPWSFPRRFARIWGQTGSRPGKCSAILRCKHREQKIDLDGAKTNATVMAAPTVPMSGIWRTIRDYIFWSYERGTIQYDVMVTLILVFVFLSPTLINFKDKPVEHNPHRTGVAVVPDGQGGLIYQFEAAAVAGKDDAAIA